MPFPNGFHLRRSLETGKVPVSILKLSGPDTAGVLKVKESRPFLREVNQHLSTNRNGAGSLGVLAENQLPLRGNRLVGSEFALNCDGCQCFLHVLRVSGFQVMSMVFPHFLYKIGWEFTDPKDGDIQESLHAYFNEVSIYTNFPIVALHFTEFVVV